MGDRVAYLDNLKMFLMFLVVLGHSIGYSQWVGNVQLLTIYNCIYSFHMPLFVFISGYLSKSITCPRKKEIEILLYPYLIFQVINVFYVRYVEHGTANWNLFIPLHQNWYILALFIWRLIIPYFRLVNKKIGICITLFLSLMFSKYQIPNNLFALNYVFVFLPFFVLGYYFEVSILHKVIKQSIVICVSFILLALFALIIIGTCHDINMGLVITQAFKPPYSCTFPMEYAIRYLGFILSFLLIYLIFVEKKRKDKVNTRYVNLSGGGTMLIYLFHYFIIIPLWKVLPHYNWIISLIICMGISYTICWFFSRPRVIKVFALLLDYGILREKVVSLTQKYKNTNERCVK